VCKVIRTASDAQRAYCTVYCSAKKIALVLDWPPTTALLCVRKSRGPGRFEEENIVRILEVEAEHEHTLCCGYTQNKHMDQLFSLISLYHSIA
jgi:hypothetical protein